MKSLIEFITNLFARTRGMGNKIPPTQQNDIIKMLEDSLDKATAGTAKIDEQIAELKAIEKQLDDADQIMSPLDDLIGDLSRKTGATPEETKRVLIDRYNEGYLPGDPKRMLPEDDDRLRAFIESQKLMGNEQDLMIDILENAELPPDQMAGIRSIVQDDDPLPFGRSGEAEEYIKGLEEDALPFGRSGEADEYIQSLQSQIDDLGKAEDQIDSLIKANAQRKADLARAEELMMDMENFGKSFDEIMKMVQDEKVIPFMKFQPNPKPKKAEGGIISRVGFERGGGLTGLRPRHQGGTYDMVDAYRRKVLREMGGGEIRGNAQLQEAMQQAQRKAELAERTMLGSPALGVGSGKAMSRVYEPLLQAGFAPEDLVDAETAAQIPTRVFQGNVEQFGRRRDEGEMNAAIARLHPGLARPSPGFTFGGMKQRRRIPVKDEEAELLEYMKLAGFQEGGRVGLQDGGGPKLTRRRLLQLMGAGIGSLFMPRGAKQIAESVAPAARVIKQAPGMPDWFPLLVNQIKSKGKITREPDYKDFTSGGDTTVRYKLKDDSLSGGEIFLEEDLQSGTVSIFGRGDDGQQVSMDYFPGARTATKKGVREDPPTFEAGEFFKGEIQDFENIGVPTDDLRGGLLSWEKLSGFNLTPREKIQRMMKKFEDDYKDPNVEPDDDITEMSQGGGVGSLFKERTV